MNMRKKEQFIIRQVADEYVMMPIGATAQKFNGLIMANDVSAFIWDNIEKVETPEELIDLIYAEFEADYERISADTLEILE